MIYIHSEKIHNTLAPNLILPIVFDIIKPTSVLDVGCGIGTWLSVCKDLGVVDVLGVDGDHVNRNLIKKYILDYEFMPYDLNLSFDLSRKYDLAICLEVLEHLPESSAVNIVNSLVAHSDVILFSAAIPGQGGQNHLNEQWPSYWIDLFSRHDFVFIDKVRPLIWNNKTIEFWYRQNIRIILWLRTKYQI
jgi:2-polyprenyl-3-methyl-5-hydroxy-6-metoxy-1,4-benzoquinol methylase